MIEVRRVSADWVHPEGKLLKDGLFEDVTEWERGEKLWNLGFVEVILDESREDGLPVQQTDIVSVDQMYVLSIEMCKKHHSHDDSSPPCRTCDPSHRWESYEDMKGPKPNPNDYLPVWEWTYQPVYFQIYSTRCSYGEGFPISDVCASYQECQESARSYKV